MAAGIQTVIYPVTDFARATAQFVALTGTAPAMASPYYVGFSVAGQDIGLAPNGHAQGMTGPVAYWHVDDVVATVQSLVGAGATSLQEPTDVGGGKPVASVQDADGNVIGLIQPA